MKENLENLMGRNNLGRVKKITKNILKTLAALLVATGIVAGVTASEAKIHKKKKNADTELHGTVKVTGKNFVVFPTDLDGGPDPINDSIKIHLDSILEHNRDIISIDATKLESIMLCEESLKTTKKFLGIFNLKNLDSRLEENGITRDSNSESWIRKIVGKRKQGSYGPYQVQLNAINKYKEDPKLYDELSIKIAKLRLPDTEGKLRPLHEQLGLSVEEMVSQIKNNTLYAFSGGGRFLIAYGIVLIDQISRETESIIDSYDGATGYSRWEKNTKEAEKQHKELLGHKNANIMSPYFLFNKGKVSYNEIGNLFNNDVFRNGMVSAYWCMDYIKNVKNSDYLFILSLLELNERFKSGGKGELNIFTPTGNFGPSTMALVNKYFNQNFKKNADAEKFMDSLPKEEKQKLKDRAFDQFETNMRLLYTLNHDDRSGINQLQSKYLSECLDITFNHMYAGVNMFSKFIGDECGNNSISINDNLYKYRDSYISDQNKQALEDIKKIMTDEESFMTFTGLSRISYLLRIKSYLCPTLLGATDRIYQTKGIIPVIQDHKGGEGARYQEGVVNESNSILRSKIGVNQEQEAQENKKRGVEYVLQPGDTNIDSLKNIMRNQQPVREYLQTCRTNNGDIIKSPDDIPEELMLVMLRGDDGYYPLFENGKRFYEGDTIRIRYIELDTVYSPIVVTQKATKEIKEPRIIRQKSKKGDKNKKYKTVINTKTEVLCDVDSNGVLKVKKGGNLQDILYFYYEHDQRVKKMLDSLVGKPITQKNDITRSIIKDVVRKFSRHNPQGTKIDNPDLVKPGEKFMLVLPLN